MAIKTRKPASPEAIEAFGAAADQPVGAQPAAEVDTPPTGGGEARPVPRPRATPAATRRAAPELDLAPQWPRDLAKTVTLRYPDPTIPQLLAEIAAVDERSQHSVALRALRRGLDDLKREHGL